MVYIDKQHSWWLRILDWFSGGGLGCSSLPSGAFWRLPKPVKSWYWASCPDSRPMSDRYPRASRPVLPLIAFACFQLHGFLFAHCPGVSGRQSRPAFVTPVNSFVNQTRHDVYNRGLSTGEAARRDVESREMSDVEGNFGKGPCPLQTSCLLVKNYQCCP